MFSRVELPHKITACLPGILLATSLTSIPGVAFGDEVILANGAPRDGNVMFIGDKKQWDTMVVGEAISSASGYLTAEPRAEEKAVRADWNGEGEAQFFLAHKAPADYTQHLDEQSALVVILKVEKKPTKKVLMKMGCGYPCASNADITKLLKALTPQQWVRLSIDLECFAAGGLNIKNVDTPLLITTRGEMSLSIADISLVSGLGPKATISCQK
jgi:beta-glucosidase